MSKDDLENKGKRQLTDEELKQVTGGNDPLDDDGRGEGAPFPVNLDS